MMTSLGREMCPLCSSVAPPLSDCHDDRHAAPGVYAYHKCSQCQAVFQVNRLPEERLAALYTEYYPRSALSIDDWKPSANKSGFLAWLEGYASVHRYVPSKSKVLDIGCGFGEALGYYRSIGCEAYGYELDENAGRIASAQGLNIRQGIFEPGHWEESFFDVVTLDQVLEHIYEPVDFLTGLRKVLRPGGLLILSTPNAVGLGLKLWGKKWIHWHAPYHVHLYTPKSLHGVLAKCGFACQSLRTVTYSVWLRSQLLHLIYYPKPGEKSLLWDVRAQGRKKFSQRIAGKAVSLSYKARLIQSASRLLDSLGAGDNLLCIAEAQ